MLQVRQRSLAGNQSLALQQETIAAVDFSIGICAADRATNLERLLRTIQMELFPEGFVLRKIILVASGCDPNVLSAVRRIAMRDQRLVIIEEPVRQGKSEAINRIIAHFDNDFLVLVNSDALPERGAIAKLLVVLAEDDTVGMVSASPSVDSGPRIAQSVSELMWNVHNECLLTLNNGNLNNHCCDELIAIRSEALRDLPLDTINDGAYMAGKAALAGYSIHFHNRARVRIDVPQRLVDIIRQRRRVAYGHSQIWKSLGQPPKTLESMLLVNPFFSFSILVKTIARSPRLVIALPFAILGEVISAFLAIWDTFTSTKKHVLWERYGSKS